jgi:hypothetical protein
VTKFRADITEERYFPDLGVLVNPGDVVELPAGTDAVGLVEVKDSKVSKSIEPVVVAQEVEGA